MTDLFNVAPWVAAIGVIVWVGFKVAPFVLKLVHFIDDVAGEPARPGVDARPGLMERLQAVEDKQDDLTAAVKVVQHEVTTNHGSSLKDSTKRLEGRVDAIEGKLNDLHERYVKE
ncbi:MULTISPECIES: hypothetical protein [unclassified Microbacterium]|uniref:hypothetical protein n=1 Tax=unclassified Microbacterium TaxID=2609290 RepID=UPI0030100C3F